MAVAFVNRNTMTQTASNPSVARTVSTGSNLCAFAIILFDQAAGMSVSSVTLGGNAMTAAGTASHNSTQNPYAAVYYLVNPPTGTPTLAITVSGTITDIYYNLVVFSGVNQTTPIRAGTYQNGTTQTASAGGTFSMTVTSNANDLTLTAVNSPNGATGTNQTSDGINTGGAYSGSSDHATTAAASVTHTWSGLGANTPLAVVGFSINGDSGGGGGSSGGSYYYGMMQEWFYAAMTRFRRFFRDVEAVCQP